MAEKSLNSRIINKHDIEANWVKATNFIPKQGEMIVYDIDENYTYERFKIGDGITLVSNLPFIKTGLEVSDTEEELEEGVYLTNADQLGGLNASEYVTKEDLITMGGVGGAVSSVNGKTGNVTITAEDLGAITSINGITPNENGTLDLNVGDVGGLTVNLEGAIEGESAKINADLLGGIAADNYALKTNVVTSVNGQTGDVVVTEGGGSIDTSNFYSTSNPPPYPVTSVNGSTGAVQITAASLGALTSAPVTSVGGKTGAVTLSAGTGISVSGTTISNSGVTSVNGHTGAITIPAIKYVDLTFTFSGESLCQYATAPSDLTSSGQIINVISHTDSVIITAAEISGGKILIYGRDPSKISTDEWSGSYIDFKTGSFSARVFYF